MSARSDLHEAVCGDGCGMPSRCARTNRLIDAYAHQLAEQLRATANGWSGDGYTAEADGLRQGADLIDPGVER